MGDVNEVNPAKVIKMDIKSIKKNIYLSDLIKGKEDYKKMGIKVVTKRIKEYRVCSISIDLINDSENAYEIDLRRIIMGDNRGKFHMFEKKARNKNNVDYRILHCLRNYLDEKFVILPLCKINIDLVYPSIDDYSDIIKFAYRYHYSLTKDLANKYVEEFNIVGG